MYLGEIYAFATVICWVICSLLFERAGKRVGSTTVNLAKMLGAIIFISIYTVIERGMLFPTDATPQAWLWLSLSGVIGFFIGDIALFKAFISIGTRLSLLIYSLVAPFTAIMSYLVLQEEMGRMGIVGMVITILGVSIVVFKRDGSSAESRAKMKGIVLALIGTLCQSGGTILSKLGMTNSDGSIYDPYASTQIRIISTLICFILFFTLTGRWKYFFKGLQDMKATVQTAIGSFFGPFLGVSFNLVAISLTKAGRVSTITSILPVAIIIPQILIFKQRVGIREITGALIAVAGVSMLFL